MKNAKIEPIYLKEEIHKYADASNNGELMQSRDARIDADQQQGLHANKRLHQRLASQR